MKKVTNTLSKSLYNQSTKLFTNGPFSHLKTLPADPIFGLMAKFNEDKNPKKISLSAGTYKTDDNKPWVLTCVRKAQEIHYNNKLDNEYLGIEGLQSFINNSLKIAYGPENKSLQNKEIAGIQTLSGTGALLMGMKFIADNYNLSRNVMIPTPSWPNHNGIATMSGLNIQGYPYYCPNTNTLMINELLESLDRAEQGSIVVLHSCAHNPTGLDPSQDQWKQIFAVLKKRNHLAFFDNAYQGFASGDLDKDAWALRYYAAEGNRMMLAQSYAKNFGLYGQRTGCFSMICADQAETNVVMGYLKLISRRLYSNPPKYGAQLVDIVLNDPALYAQWKEDLITMSSRINDMRVALHKNLVESDSKQNWDHIIKQIGMFAYTGISKEKVLQLRAEESIYFTDDGRISISGLNTKNVSHVADCFNRITKNGF